MPVISFCVYFGLILMLLAAAPPEAQTPVADGQRLLAQARAQLGSLDLPKVSRTLKELEKTPSLTRAQVLELYELKGVSEALGSHAPAAQEAFSRLLLLDPAARLHGRYPPKVTTPFAEARASVREAAPLAISLESRAAQDGHLTQVVVGASGASPGLVARLQLELVENEVSRTVSLTTLQPTGVEVSGQTVVARVVALNALGWRLLESEAVFKGPAPRLAAPLPAPPTVPTSLPPPITVAAKPSLGLRPLSYGVMAGGGVTLLVGMGFGIQSAVTRNRLQTVPTVDGVAVGLTRQQALDLNTQMMTHATVADVLFVSGGVLAAGGVVLWLLGLPPPGGVSLGLSAGPSHAWASVLVPW